MLLEFLIFVKNTASIMRGNSDKLIFYGGIFMKLMKTKVQELTVGQSIVYSVIAGIACIGVYMVGYKAADMYIDHKHKKEIKRMESESEE